MHFPFKTHLDSYDCFLQEFNVFTTIMMNLGKTRIGHNSSLKFLAASAAASVSVVILAANTFGYRVRQFIGAWYHNPVLSAV